MFTEMFVSEEPVDPPGTVELCCGKRDTACVGEIVGYVADGVTVVMMPFASRGTPPGRKLI
jgi:hypothetical protein